MQFLNTESESAEWHYNLWDCKSPQTFLDLYMHIKTQHKDQMVVSIPQTLVIMKADAHSVSLSLSLNTFQEFIGIDKR